MTKKIIIIILALLMVGVSVKEIMDLDNYMIDGVVVSGFVDGDIITKDRAQQILIKYILTHCEYEAKDQDYEQMELSITQINLEKKDDLLLILKVSDDTTLIAAYTKFKDKYEFLGMVDSFEVLISIQAMPLISEGKDMIVVREHIDQMAQTYEDGIYVRVYYYNKGRFTPVFNALEKYRAFHNEFWDYQNMQEGNWLMVSQKTDILWENEYHPVIHVKYWQTYLVSDEVNKINPPEHTAFSIVSQRDLTLNFTWSKEYRAFILAEGTDLKNGRKLAIIEDLGITPFSLVAELKNDNDYYRVKYENGKIEKLLKSQIKLAS